MILIDAIAWWYSWGWSHVLNVGRDLLKRLYHTFSVRQMVRTLFAPWKEDRMTGSQGLDSMMRALVMNGVARLIGFFIRSIFLLIYGLATFGVTLGTGLIFVLWPMLPVMPLVAIFFGVLP